MYVLNREHLRCWDVDDTLIMHQNYKPHEDEAEWRGVGHVSIKCPYTGDVGNYYINYNMVRLLKEEHARGGCNVVWSRGGYQWAEAVVKALELGPMVSLIMSKPLVYMDDKPVTEWMTDRVYIPPNVKYK